jgi:hypothetical protein
VGKRNGRFYGLLEATSARPAACHESRRKAAVSMIDQGEILALKRLDFVSTIETILHK